MDCQSCIDKKALDSLREIGGDALVVGMIEAFLGHVPHLISEARASLASGNLEPATRTGHTLNSSARNYGSKALQDAASHLERAARAGRTAELPALLDEVERVFVHVRIHLESEADKRRTAGTAATG